VYSPFFSFGDFLMNQASRAGNYPAVLPDFCFFANAVGVFTLLVDLFTVFARAACSD